MIQEIIDLAKTQPILVGGIGTVLTSSALYLVRSVPNRISSFATNSVQSQFFIDNKNDYFNAVNTLVFRCKIPWTFRKYEPAEKSEEYSYEQDDFISHEGDYLIPGYGTGWGIWRGILFSFEKDREDKGYLPIKKLHIRFYSRNQVLIEKFFKEAVSLTRDKDIQKMYITNGSGWRRITNKKLRPLNTVFLELEKKNKIVSTVENFLLNEQKFIQQGIPYKLCIMLYGIPGTGKTSFLHALASHLKLDIYFVDRLGNLKNQMSNFNFGRGIVIIEDIDTLSLDLNREDEESVSPIPALLGYSPREKKKKPKEEKKSDGALHDLLNSLDGFTCPHGLILAMTSNHPETLDRALIRPGRIDLAVEIGPLNFQTAGEMFVAFYGTENFSLWNSITDNYTMTVGSKLQELFLNYDVGQVKAPLLALFNSQKEPLASPAGGVI